MHYFVDNLFRPDKAPYCSNCSRDADCIALLLVSGSGGSHMVAVAAWCVPGCKFGYGANQAGLRWL